MDNKNLTRKDLQLRIHKEIGFSKSTCKNLVDDIFNILTETLKSHDKVKINSFGTFKSINKKERVGRNPKNKKETIISARKVVTFKHNDYDSLATVTAMHKFMWYEGKPINYEPDKMPHSYDLPDYYVLNFAVNILPKEMLVERKNIIGDKIYPFYLDEVESFDIDNQIEFDIAKTIYESGILDE